MSESEQQARAFCCCQRWKRIQNLVGWLVALLKHEFILEGKGNGLAKVYGTKGFQNPSRQFGGWKESLGGKVRTGFRAAKKGVLNEVASQLQKVNYLQSVSVNIFYIKKKKVNSFHS